MARTTTTAVQEVIETNLTTQQIRAFIEDASLWVTEELADAELSTGRLEIIERYLACSLIRIRDLGLANATIQNVSETYQVDPTVTDYLLRAASFDPTGTVRKEFLAPKDAPGAGKAILQVGTGFYNEPTRPSPDPGQSTES